jgi:hypothetical protein
MPPTPTPKPSPSPTPTLPNDGYKAEVPVLWEQRAKSGRKWTVHAFSIIEKYGANLMLGSSDMKSFCPTYFSLSPNQKVNFWAYLISSMVKYESNFDPTMRYVESTMGTDPITGKQIVSEGLLQLSYQDVLAYPYCNEFDWEYDRRLPANDPKKTILNPYKNLTCGIRILNQQVKRYDLIAVDRGAYWAVLKPSSKYTKLPQIKALTNAVPFCQY